MSVRRLLEHRLSLVDELLRVRDRFAVDARVSLASVLVILCAAGALYGLALGSFSLRPLQCFYSASKVPILILASSLFVLPNFYVLHAVLGLADDFAVAVRAVFCAQATLAVTLAALAPLTLLTYASSSNYQFATAANGAIWLVAVLAGQVVLRRHYRALVAKNVKHEFTRRAWGFLYALVAIQLAWMLRPFIGNPGQVTSFLRDEPLSNAFVVVSRIVLRLLGG